MIAQKECKKKDLLEDLTCSLGNHRRKFRDPGQVSAQCHKPTRVVWLGKKKKRLRLYNMGRNLAIATECTEISALLPLMRYNRVTCDLAVSKARMQEMGKYHASEVESCGSEERSRDMVCGNTIKHQTMLSNWQLIVRQMRQMNDMVFLHDTYSWTK